MTATNSTVKEKLTEALLSDEVTPSAATRISGMLVELAHESVTEKRLDAMNRELEDIMGDLTGPTVDEIKRKVAKGELALAKWPAIQPQVILEKVPKRAKGTFL